MQLSNGGIMNWQVVQAQLPMVKEAQAVRITNTKAVADICTDIINLAQECFQVLTLNSKNDLIDRHLITLGLADACLIHPREVFRSAILDNAAAIVCIHNHPSGDPTPSAEDIRITRQLVQAGKIVDIKVLDHVIIGRPNGISQNCLSMRELGIIDFS